MICVSIPPPAQEEGFGRLFFVGFFAIELPRVIGFDKFIVIRFIVIVTELHDRTIPRVSTDNPAMKLFNLIFDLIVI